MSTPRPRPIRVVGQLMHRAFEHDVLRGSFMSTILLLEAGSGVSSERGLFPVSAIVLRIRLTIAPTVRGRTGHSVVRLTAPFATRTPVSADPNLLFAISETPSVRMALLTLVEFACHNRLPALRRDRGADGVK
jgi:hypothetical protein